MNKNGISYPVVAALVLCLIVIACKNTSKPPVSTDIVSTPEELNQKTSENIRASIEFAVANNGLIGDSVRLSSFPLVQEEYQKNQYTPIWGSHEQWLPLTDSLLQFLAQAKLLGLFPEDYHLPALTGIRQKMDSASARFKKDAALWSKADLLLSDAFFSLIRDIKLGRLPQDSVSLRKDSVLAPEFYHQRLAIARKNNSLALAFQSLEPRHKGYGLLKKAIRNFLDSIDTRVYTVVPSPKDPLFRKALQTRLYEAGYLMQDSVMADSAEMAAAVKRFQQDKNITVDGKVGEGTVRVLNTTDKDRFVRIAITMDRYKQLPDTMPDRYVWVNLPGYYMLLHQGDSINVVSKIICGKPATRTPLLTSAISEMITYPQWTVPTSIIVKEILPAVKKNPGYLAKKGFSLIDSKGDEIDPYTVDWSKYSKGIPYKVVQGSGDANALGILKFNFPNKYAVYLHDTNQRYLFAQTTRSLSHGCVRVQDWSKLAYSIIRYDHKPKLENRPSALEDSLNAWLERKEKHSIAVRNRLPVYIRYFTCEAKNDRLVFYDDIYGEDKWLQQKYFAGK